MIENISSVKERILHFAKIKNVTQVEMCEKLGMTHSSFRGKAKNRPINSDAIVILLSIFPDINLDWLFSGLGKPLKEILPEFLTEDDKNKYLVDRVTELSQEVGHLQGIVIALTKQTEQKPLKEYLLPEPSLRVAEPKGEYAVRKTKKGKSED